MLCYVMSCHVMSCHVMLCYVMLCYVMLCYVMLYYIIILIVYVFKGIVETYKKLGKKSESPMGFEPMTFRTPDGCCSTN